MPSLAVARLAINIVSSLGVTKIVGDIVKNNTTVLTTSQKYLVNAGGLVLGSMIVEHAIDHVNTTIDRIISLRNPEENTNTDSDSA